MNKHKLLMLLVVVQSALLGTFFLNPGPAPARADLNIPNPSERQVEIIEQLKTVNTKLDALTTLLQSGDVQVKIVQPEAAK